MTDDFARPNLLWFLLLDGGLAATAALALDDHLYDSVSEQVPLPPRQTVKAIWWGAVGLHVLEALVARRSAGRHGLPAGRWARQTLVVGFPSLLALRRVKRSR